MCDVSEHTPERDPQRTPEHAPVDGAPLGRGDAERAHQTANGPAAPGATGFPDGAPPGNQVAATMVGERLRKRFGRGGWILDGADLAVPPGVLTVVAGGNGSGKSTLLRLLAGAGRPTSGVIRDRPAAVAYVPERLPGRGPMTAREYLTHLGRIRRLPAQTVRERGAMLLERLRLHPGPDVPITELSKGNAQKVALAQAFLAPVGLIVLDEPHTGLDEPAREALGGMLWEARGDGVAILISAHDYREVPGADAVHLLQDGRVRPVTVDPTPARQVEEEGEPSELCVILRATSAQANLNELTKDPYVTVLDDRMPDCRLVVPVEHADALLLHALRAGWSLREAWPEHQLAGNPGNTVEGRRGW
jgi:ABC-2 type transport system ATP-binding protein